MESNLPTDHEFKERLLQFLLQFISENKQKKFREFIQYRTRHITIVLENIYQSHNASAVLRSCDCFGIQDVHIIENLNKYQVNPDVELGSAQWLTMHKYSGGNQPAADCLKKLHNQGYKIVVTTPHKDDFTPENMPLENKIAVVFGTELAGISQEALSKADSFLRIPMVGFTESLNISVSAALILYTLTRRLRQSGIRWELPEKERTEILLGWARSVVKKADLLEKEFLKKKSNT